MLTLTSVAKDLFLIYIFNLFSLTREVIVGVWGFPKRLRFVENPSYMSLCQFKMTNDLHLGKNIIKHLLTVWCLSYTNNICSLIDNYWMVKITTTSVDVQAHYATLYPFTARVELILNYKHTHTQ